MRRRQRLVERRQQLSNRSAYFADQRAALVERGWRDMKQIIDLRPVYHHLEDRIRAHVTLCWLALLLIRITETSTGQTWNQLRAELQRIHLGTFTGDHGTFTPRTQLTAGHKLILKALDLAEPPLVVSATPATP
jgi:hypothetical protein